MVEHRAYILKAWLQHCLRIRHRSLVPKYLIYKAPGRSHRGTNPWYCQLRRQPMDKYFLVCVCVCIHVYIYMYIHSFTYTHLYAKTSRRARRAVTYLLVRKMPRQADDRRNRRNEDKQADVLSSTLERTIMLGVRERSDASAFIHCGNRPGDAHESYLRL